MSLSTVSSEPVSFLEAVTRPFVRDWPVVFGSAAFFFACQYGSRFIMNRASSKFKKLTEDQKDNWCVRFTSVVNSFICFRTTYLFVKHGAINGLDLDSQGLPSLYSVIPGQLVGTEMLLGYFIWDIVIVILYGWGAVYFAHGCASALGIALISFPFAERLHGWFTGAFECSNFLFHLADMLEMLDTAKWAITPLKVTFSALFLAVRPIGGSWIAWKLIRAAYRESFENNGRTCHNQAAMWGVVGVSCALLSLQYLWSGFIVQGILAELGLVAPPAGDAKQQEAARRKKQEEEEAAAKKKE